MVVLILFNPVSVKLGEWVEKQYCTIFEYNNRKKIKFLILQLKQAVFGYSHRNSLCIRFYSADSNVRSRVGIGP